MQVDNRTAILAAREEELAAIYENVPGIVFYIAVEPDAFGKCPWPSSAV